MTSRPRASRVLVALLAPAVTIPLILPAAAAASGLPTGVPAVANAPAADTPAGPDLSALAGARAALRPGGDGVLSVAVLNRGSADAAAPVTVTITGLPAGVTFDGTLPGTSSYGLPLAWSCDTAPGGARCALTNADGTSQVALPGTAVANVQLLLAATTDADLADVTATIDAASPSGKGSTTATIPAATADDGPDGVYLDVEAPAAVTPGKAARETVRIAPLGPASIGGAAGPVVLKNAVPTGAQNVESTGDGWACDAGECTWTGPQKAPGHALPELTLDFTAPATTGDLAWKPSVHATASDGAVLSMDAPSSTQVTRGPPSVAIVAHLDGTPSVPAGGRLPVAVDVGGNGLSDPAGTITVTAPLADGWTLAAPPAKPWDCAVTTGTLSCHRDADLGAPGTDTLRLVLGVGEDTEPGAASVTFAGTVTGATPTPDGKPAPTGTSTVTAIVAPPGQAALVARTVVFDPQPHAVLDGSPVNLPAGTPVRFGIEPVNRGDAVVPAGTTVTVALQVPDGVKLAASGWSCTTATTDDAQVLACTTTTSRPIRLDAAGPRLDVDATVIDAPAGRATWPVATAIGTVDTAALQTQLASDGATLQGVNVAVVYRLPELQGIIRPQRSAHSDGTGAMSVVVLNGGDATAAGYTTTVVPADGVTLTGDGDACHPWGAGAKGILSAFGTLGIVTCTGDALKPGASKAFGLDVRGTPDDGTGDGSLGAFAAVTTPQVPGLPDGKVSYFRGGVPVVEPLGVTAEAVPPVISSARQPNGEAPLAYLKATVTSGITPVVQWRQVPVAGEPVVAFATSVPGASGDSSRVVAFAVPQVERETVLHFAVEVRDGDATAGATVSVTVEPPTVSAAELQKLQAQTHDDTGTDATGAAFGVTTQGGTATGAGGGVMTTYTGPALSLAALHTALTLVADGLARALPLLAHATGDTGDTSGEPARGPVGPAESPYRTVADEYGCNCTIQPTPTFSFGGQPSPTIGYRFSLNPPSNGAPNYLLVQQDGSSSVASFDIFINNYVTGGYTPVGTSFVLQGNDNYITVRVPGYQIGNIDLTSVYEGAINAVRAVPPAGGIPPISIGDPMSGTLTADPGVWTVPISDTGVSTGTLVAPTYQWQLCTSTDATTCSDIDGATNQTYVPPATTLGKYLRVNVTEWTDYTSSAYQHVTAASPMFSFGTSRQFVFQAPELLDENAAPLAGTVAPGTKVYAVPGVVLTTTGLKSLLSPGGTVQWQRCTALGACTDIDAATSNPYVPTTADVGYDLQALTTPADGDPIATNRVGVNAGLPVNSAAPGVTVTGGGDPAVGRPMTATTGTWNDPGGANAFTYAYQWLDCPDDGGACAPVATGGTESTYTPQPSDVGQRIAVRVTATNPTDSPPSSASATSTHTVAVAGTVPPVVTTPIVTPPGGATVTGAQVSATLGSFQWATSTTGQWLVCDSAGGALGTAPAVIPSDCTVADSDVDEPTTYTIKPADIGKYVRWLVTATYTADGAVYASYWLSTAVVGPVGALTPSSTAAPVATPVSGWWQQGTTITVTPGLWAADPAVASERSYAVQACASDDPATCADIAGAPVTVADVSDTTPVTLAYTVGAGDVGKRIRVVETVTGAVDGTAATAATDLSDTVLPGAPVNREIPLTGVADGTAPVALVPITGDVGTWASSVGAATYAEQWLSCDSDGCVNATGDGANSLTYTANDADVGRWLRLRVTATNSFGSTSALSTTTAIVAQNPAHVVTATTDVDGGSLHADNGATVTIHGSGTRGDGAPVTLSWEQIGGPDAGLTTADDGATATVRAPLGGSGALVLLLTATDADGRTGTATVTILYGSTDVPPLLCLVAAAAANSASGGGTVDLGGGMVLTVGSASLSTQVCGADTTVTIDDASLRLFDWFSVSGVHATVDATGITITAGTLTVPGDSTFAGFTLGVTPGGALTIPFPAAGSDAQASPGISGDLSGSSGTLPSWLGLGSGWRIAYAMHFAVGDGGQEAALHVLAYNGTASGADDDGLPVPDDGVPTLRLDGTLGTDKSMSLAVTSTNLLRFGDVTLNVGGSLTRSGAGTLSFAVHGALAAPVDLGRGVTLTSASLAWDGKKFTGSGGVSVATGGGTITGGVDFTFANPSSWSLKVHAEGGKTLDFGSGFVVHDAVLAGSLSRGDDGTRFGLHIGASGIAFGSSGVRADDVDIALAGVCGGASAGCSATGDLAATITVPIGGTTLRGPVHGTFDTAQGTFDLTAGPFDAFSPVSGVTISGLTVHVARTADAKTATTGGGTPPKVFVAEASGSADVLGVTASAQLSLGSKGFLLDLTVGNWTPFPGAPTMQQGSLHFATYPTSVEVAGKSLNLPANTLFVTGVIGAPDWLQQAAGGGLGTAVISGRFTLGAADAELKATFTFPDVTLFSAPGASMHLDGISLDVRFKGGQVSLGASADTRLVIPAANAGDPPSTLGFSMGATYNPVTQTLRGQLTLDGGQAGWQNAFGIPGLTVKDLTVALGVQFGTGIPTPSLGFAGTAILPNALAGPLGIQSGTPITLVANVDVENACFAFSIGKSDRSTLALDVLNAGVVTAKYAELVVAPTGCTVGPYTYAPGIALTFDGAVQNVPVLVNATVSTSPLKIDATMKVGAFDLGPLHVDNTVFSLNMVPTGAKLALDGRVSMFGATAQIHGAFQLDSGTQSADFAATFHTPDLGGFQINELNVAFHVTTKPMDVSAHADVDLTILGAPQRGSFDFRIANGELVGASAKIQLNAPLTIAGSGVTLQGSFAVDIVPHQFPTIAFSGTADVNGHRLGSASGLVTGNGFTLDAMLDIPGVLSGHLHGALAWKSTEGAKDPAKTITITLPDGSVVPAKAGDFQFSARGLEVTLAGFHALGNVELGKSGSHVWGDLDATLLVYVNAQTNGTVTVAGSFDSNGDFSLKGEGAAVIAGYHLPHLAFDVARSGGDVSVGASVQNLGVPDVATVSMSGQFARNSTWGTLFRLTASADVTIAGYTFGKGEFALYRDVAPASADPANATDGLTPLVSNGCTSGSCIVRAGLNIAATLSVPTLAKASVLIAVSSSGYAVFDARVAVTGPIGSALGSPTAWVHFAHQPSGYTSLAMSGSVHDLFGIPGHISFDASFDSDGAYDLSGTASAGPLTGGPIDFGFAKVKGTASGSFSLAVSGTATSTPSVDVSLSGSAQLWEQHLNWKFRYTDWNSFFSARVDGGTNPPHFTVAFELLGHEESIRLD